VVIGSSLSREKRSWLKVGKSRLGWDSQKCANPSKDHQANVYNDHKSYQHVRRFLKRPFGTKATAEESTDKECNLLRRLRQHAADLDLVLITLPHRWVHYVHPRGAKCKKACFGLVLRNRGGREILWPWDQPYGWYLVCLAEDNGSSTIKNKSWSIIVFVGSETKPRWSHAWEGEVTEGRWRDQVIHWGVWSGG
jgi:hypothetical protein